MKRKTPQRRMTRTHKVQYVDYREFLDIAQARQEDPFILVLDGLEDPRNFGAILRTAECAGVHGVIIPNRRSVQVNETVETTSTGASNLVPIAQVSNITQVLENLKKENLWITGLDMQGQPYQTVDFKGGVVLVVGSEGKGISRIVKEKCDFLAKIPMKGQVESLNVSVAAGIVMYEVLRKR